MSDKDWTDLGNNIRDMVDDAVRSQDFRKLNENICRTVSDGIDNISRSIKKNLGYENPNDPGQNHNGQWGPLIPTGPAYGRDSRRDLIQPVLFPITGRAAGAREMRPGRDRALRPRGIRVRPVPGDGRAVFPTETIRRDSGSITVRHRTARGHRCRMPFHQQETA